MSKSDKIFGSVFVVFIWTCLVGIAIYFYVGDHIKSVSTDERSILGLMIVSWVVISLMIVDSFKSNFFKN